MNFNRRAVLAALGACAAPFGPTQAGGRAGPAPAWYASAIVIDGLGSAGDPYVADGVLRMSDRGWAETVGTGVTAVRDTVFPVGNVVDGWGAYQKAIAEKHALLAANTDRLMLVRRAADIEVAKRSRKFAVILGTQDSAMVGPALDRFAQLRADGVMTVQLTYNNRNLCGDGALEADNAGLSTLGHATIERLESERLLLDLSHGGAKTMAEGAAFAKRPLVISHTGARAIFDHPRNTSDETLRAVADRGGVVGIYFMPFLAAGGHPAGSDLIAHIEHVAQVVGEDHIGLGADNGVLPIALDPASRADLDKAQRDRIAAGLAAPGEAVGVYPLVEAYNSVDRYERLADDLARRGWATSRLTKLFGLNFLRVYREVWGA